MTIVQAIILAIIEGLTEFLPVSSTGHMIIGSSLMGIAEEPFTKTFTVAIQFGAILSVVVLYWKKFLKIDLAFYIKLAIAVIPALLFGFLLDDYIDALLGNVIVVAISLLLGGIIFIAIDNWFNRHDAGRSDDMPNNKSAFVIGLFQCIAMIPGVSRSAASIIGGLTQKLTKRAAAEFSFLLAVPTMAAATLYSVLLKNCGTEDAPVKGYEMILSSHDNTMAFIVGNVVAFIVAWLAIKTFIGYITKHGFKIFGWYRIIVGAVILILHFAGIELKMI